MAKEIQAAYDSGSTLKAIVLNSVGQAWYTVTPSFENYSTSHISSYAITMTEQGTASGIYEGDFPSSITAGVYSVIVYKLAGGSLAETDLKVAQGTIHWSGSAVYGLNSIGAVAGAVGSVTGNVGGNVVGSVASVTGNVGGNVAGSVASVSGNVGGSVASVSAGVALAPGAITYAAFTTGAIQNDCFSAGAIDNTVLADDAISAAKFADDAITSDAIADSALLPAAFDTTTIAAIADRIISRGAENVEDSADTLSLATLILATFKSEIEDDDWIVYKSDGTTEFHTFTIVTSTGVDPIVQVS